ncbi:TetR/AcrR family transcriptional regulator [Glaciihabitans sp. dw_435]|uniref:TetR/AcrR family transcriptional regulator n=1 Tax=Glaciihabitans sp. dw_435 TaxID=2720081 RepID=UPI001BD45423|nr:TetR/AcrR family transcriptional regulator [Glaciihabitans sp. dw_435]
MTNGTPAIIDDDQDHSSRAPRGRDADATRSLLLQSARRRFALEGYGSTTVRDIARDAGVNVALINRYFESKEGLFEACLAHAAEQFDQPTVPSLDRAVQVVVDRVTVEHGSEDSFHMMLLLRTSGDERADAIRRRTLRNFAERMAALAGWTPDAVDGDALLLRAEVAICASLGITLLRSTSGLEPLSSASRDDLAGPIRDLFSALLR